MAYILDVAAGISYSTGGAYGQLLSIIANELRRIIVELQRTLAFIADTTAYIVFRVTSDLAYTYAVSVGLVTTTVSTAISLSSVSGLYACGDLEATLAGFENLTSALRLRVLLNGEWISGLVGRYYRDVSDSIYRRVAVFSEITGMGAGFLPNALQVARAASFRTSIAMGKNYSLAEATWLYDLRSLLGRIQSYPSVYADNPVRIYNDINELIITPGSNAVAIVQLSIFTRIEGVLNAFVEVFDAIAEVQDNIEHYKTIVPELIRQKIRPLIDEVRGEFTEWRNTVYQPDLTSIREKSDLLKVRLESTIAELHYYTELTRRPGDLLLTVDSLSTISRIDQEDKVADVATRRDKRVTAAWMEEYARR